MIVGIAILVAIYMMVAFLGGVGYAVQKTGKSVKIVKGLVFEPF